MGELERAIHDFQERQRKVYQADPGRLRRDGAAAERVIGDHAGRWLFELLQNADDAGATEVCIRVEGKVLYVADNGTGIRPDAVKAISGTDLSDKKFGTIGRKGIGFKSIYTLTRNPHVLTVGGEGVEFSRDRAADWLRKCGFEDNNIPFQWIPFLIYWEDAVRQDPVLKSFMNYKTVVRLPLESEGTLQEIERTIQQWPAHALFALRHLRMIVGPDLCVSIERQAVGCDGVGQWRLDDSRDGSSTTWLVRWVREEVPSRLLETLPEADRMAIGREPVGLLVAAPIVDDTVLVTSDHWPIHVFYPTERPAPVPLLLRAEFVVKGDRTDLVPLERSPFNAWLADRLAELVCAFVDSVGREDAPSTSLRCLRPLQNMQTHATTSALWERIADTAKKRLRLADAKGRRRLRLEEARLVATTVEPAHARNILQQTTVESTLLHPAFDRDEEALGCTVRDVSHLHLGWDIESYDPTSKRLRFIEVKGRVAGASTITLTCNELMAALNVPDQWILAIVEVREDGTAGPPRYVRDYPFREPMPGEAAVTLKLSALLARAVRPSP